MDKPGADAIKPCHTHIPTLTFLPGCKEMNNNQKDKQMENERESWGIKTQI
jgi:hypothetical protein